MSSTVDSKVVDLQLHNSQFEENAATSIKTLDKLKQALTFNKTSDAIENISKSLKNVNTGALEKGINAIQIQFSALNTVADTVIRRITNGFMDAAGQAKNFVKSVTLDQVSAGWDKYAEKTSAVQTIMAATAKNYDNVEEQMADVNAQLTKLNWFTDETSYSFLDMVNNIGKFTSNNIALDKSVTAMEGISTWAAVSGANVQEAGRAMYNLSQAIATGSVKLMDWKSIENANMATAEFKQTAIETAEALGTLVKKGEDTWITKKGSKEVSVSNFNENLKQEWFTGEVLMETLNKYGKFTDELYKLTEETGLYTSDLLENMTKFKEGTLDLDSLAEETGVSADRLKELFTGISDETMAFGEKAFRAAQEAKTFQEAVDSVKDAVSTGWMNTWEIVFGDYTHAKTLWTNLANNLYDVFAEGGNERNEMLKEAFAIPEKAIIDAAGFEKLQKAGIAGYGFRKAVLENAKAHRRAAGEVTDDLDKIDTRSSAFLKSLDSGWLTKDVLEETMDMILGTGEAAEKTSGDIEKIRDAAKQVVRGDFGNDMAKRFEKLAELDLDPQTVQDYVNAWHKASNGTWEYTDAIKEQIESQLDLSEATAEVSSETLKSLGISEEYAEYYRKAVAEAKESGVSVESALQASGYELWAEALNNIMDTIVNVVTIAKTAWRDIFPPLTSIGLYQMIVGLNKFSTAMAESTDAEGDLHGAGRRLYIAFKTIASVVGIVVDIFKAVASVVGGIVSSVWTNFGDIILNIAEKFELFVIHFKEWLESTQALQKISGGIVGFVDKIGKGIRSWIDNSKGLKLLQNQVVRFRAAFSLVGKELPRYFRGLGISFNVFKAKVKSLGGIKFNNLSDIFKAFRDTIVKYTTNFDGFKPLKIAFAGLKSDVKQYLSEMGVDVDGLGKVLDNIKGIIDGIIDSVGKAFDTVSKKVGKFAEGFGGFEVINLTLIRFRAAFHLAMMQVPKLGDKAKEAIENFKAKVEALGGFKVSNIGKIFSALGETVSDFFKDSAALEGFKNAFGGLWKGIKAGLLNAGIDVDAIKEKVLGFIGSIKTALSGFTIPEPIQKIFDFLFPKKDTFGEIKKNFDSSADAIKNFTNKMVPQDDSSTFIEDLQKMWDSLVKIVTNIAKATHLAMQYVPQFTSLIALLAGAKIVGGVNTILNYFKRSEKAFKAIGIASIALSLAALASALKLMADVPMAKLLGCVGVIALLAVIVGGLAFALTKMGKAKNMEKYGIAMVAFAGSLLILIIALKALEFFDPLKLMESLGKLAAVAITLGGVIFLLNKAGAAKVGIGIFAVVLSLVLLAGLLFALSKISIKISLKFIGNLVIVFGALFGVMKIVSKLGDVSKGSAIAILAASAALILIAIALHLVALLPDPAKIWPKLAVFAIFIVIAGALVWVSKYSEKAKVGPILAIIGLIAVIAIACVAMSFIPTDKLEGVVKAIAIIGAVCGALLAVSSYFKPSITALLSLIVLIAVLGIALVLITKKIKNAKKAIEVAEAIAIFALSIGAALILLAVAGSLGIGAIIGVGLLIAVIIIFAALAMYLDSHFDNLDDLSDTMDKLVLFCGKLGDAIRAIFTGTSGASPTLSEQITNLGNALNDFATAINDAPVIDMEHWGEVWGALGAVLAFDFSGLLSGLFSFVTEMSTGKTAGELAALEIKALADALASWNEAVPEGGVTVDTEGIQSLVDAVDSVSTVGFEGAIQTFISNVVTPGDTTDEDNNPITAADRFATDVQALVDALTIWNDAAPDEPITVDTEGIASLKTAVDTISTTDFWGAVGTFIKNIGAPKETDENGDPKTEVDKFADNVSSLVEAINTWNTATNTEVNVDSEGIQGLIDAIEAVPGDGLVDAITGFFTGTPNFDAFTENAKSLGAALTEFNNSLGDGLDTSKLTAVSQSVSDLASASNDIAGLTITTYDDYGNPVDRVEEFTQVFVTIAEKLKEAAAVEINTTALEGITDAARTMSLAVARISESKLDGDVSDDDTVGNVKKNVESLKSMIEGLSGIDTSGVDSFTKSLDKINLVDMSSAAEEINKSSSTEIDNSKNKEAASKAGSDIASSYTSGLSAGVGSVKTAASSVVSAAASAFQGLAISQFRGYGSRLSEAVANGISAFAYQAKNAASNLVSSAVSALGDTRSEPYQSGVYFGMGFRDGITNMIPSVVAEARSMVQRAKAMVKQTQKEGSPAKELIKSGKWFAIGFGVGIANELPYVDFQSKRLASNAIGIVNDTIAQVSETIEDGIDTQPVIRPVLDLGDIQSKSGELNSMLNFNGSPTLTPAFSAIGGNLAARDRVSQGDILSALTSLRATIGDGGTGNTYIVNGVTYDDGSNISDAVRDLIHATRVERRV